MFNPACRTLQPKMVYELTAVILNQIASGRKSVLEAYAEVVFKAWRGATGACLERIETHLIQNVGETLLMWRINQPPDTNQVFPCTVAHMLSTYPQEPQGYLKSFTYNGWASLDDSVLLRELCL